LSAATVTRLTKDWQGEATAFGQRDLSGTDFARLVGAATVPTAMPLCGRTTGNVTPGT
jgi:hypothetical protein